MDLMEHGEGGEKSGVSQAIYGKKGTYKNGVVAPVFKPCNCGAGSDICF